MEGLRHSIYVLILTPANQETVNLSKKSVPWPAAHSNTVATLCPSVYTFWGHRCAVCNGVAHLCLLHTFPCLPPPRGRPPPPAEIYTFPSTHTGSQSRHRLAAEVQRLRQAWVGDTATFQSSHPSGWRMEASWQGGLGAEEGAGAFCEGSWPEETQRAQPRLVVPLSSLSPHLGRAEGKAVSIFAPGCFVDQGPTFQPEGANYPLSLFPALAQP